MEILHVPITQQSVFKSLEEEDSIFAKFYALSSEDFSKKTSTYHAPDSYKKKKEKSPQKNCSCLRQLLCCWKKEPEVEEDYYSQL